MVERSLLRCGMASGFSVNGPVFVAKAVNFCAGFVRHVNSVSRVTFLFVFSLWHCRCRESARGGAC